MTLMKMILFYSNSIPIDTVNKIINFAFKIDDFKSRTNVDLSKEIEKYDDNPNETELR